MLESLWLLIFVGVWLLIITAAIAICMYYIFRPKSGITNSDPLTVQKGGTGVSTIADLKTKLNVKEVTPVTQGGTGVTNMFALKSALGIAAGVQKPFNYNAGNATDAALINPTMFYDMLGNTYTITGYSTDQTNYVDVIGQIRGSIASQTAIQGKLPLPVDPSSRVAMGGIISCWAGNTEDSTTWASSAANGWIVQQTNGSVYIYVKWNFSLLPAKSGNSMIVTYMVRLYST